MIIHFLLVGLIIPMNLNSNLNIRYLVVSTFYAQYVSMNTLCHVFLIYSLLFQVCVSIVFLAWRSGLLVH